jgi:hypothetical protein
MPISNRCLCFVLSRALTAMFELRAPGGKSVVKSSYSRHPIARNKLTLSFPVLSLSARPHTLVLCHACLSMLALTLPYFHLHVQQYTLRLDFGNVQAMDGAPEWTLDQIAGMAFGVRRVRSQCLQHCLKEALQMLWKDC